jgi:DNA-directed RNA polymerase alpha subunit
MDLRTAMLKALEKKVREQLQEVNSKLAQAEDRAKAEIATTNGLRTREQIDQQSKV